MKSKGIQIKTVAI